MDFRPLHFKNEPTLNQAQQKVQRLYQELLTLIENTENNVEIAERNQRDFQANNDPTLIDSPGTRGLLSQSGRILGVPIGQIQNLSQAIQGIQNQLLQTETYLRELSRSIDNLSNQWRERLSETRAQLSTLRSDDVRDIVQYLSTRQARTNVWFVSQDLEEVLPFIDPFYLEYGNWREPLETEQSNNLTPTPRVRLRSVDSIWSEARSRTRLIPRIIWDS